MIIFDKISGGGNSLIVCALRIVFDTTFLFAVILCGYTFLRGERGLTGDADLCEKERNEKKILENCKKVLYFRNYYYFCQPFRRKRRSLLNQSKWICPAQKPF